MGFSEYTDTILNGTELNFVNLSEAKRYKLILSLSLAECKIAAEHVNCYTRPS